MCDTVYKTIIHKLPEAQEKQARTRIENCIMDVTKIRGTLKQLLDEQSVWITFYGLLHNKQFKKIQCSKTTSIDKTISLYANQHDYEKSKSQISRESLIRSGVRYLTLYEMLTPTLKTSFYYDVHHVMRILLKYEFLNPIAKRLWKCIDTVIKVPRVPNSPGWNERNFHQFRTIVYENINPIIEFCTVSHYKYNMIMQGSGIFLVDSFKKLDDTKIAIGHQNFDSSLK